MDFTSDNITGVSPEILAALVSANQAETVAPYGMDDLSMSLQTRFSELFEQEVSSFCVTTGTAANALSLAACLRPFEAAFCHSSAHVDNLECGAPEFFTGGAKLLPIEGVNGKITAAALQEAIRYSGTGVLHRVQPRAVTLTQPSDLGVAYSAAEIAAIAEVAHAHGLFVHVDGARFANAVVELDCNPAEIAGKAGVDVLSFGATKNGALGAEAVVFFNQDLAQNFRYLVKRSGHILSKGRFLAAQILAYLENDLWLKNAANANRCAKQLRDGLQKIHGVEVLYPVEANLVFADVPSWLAQRLGVAGCGFYQERSAKVDHCTIRLVTSFDTSATKVSQFLNLLAQTANPCQAAA